MTKDVKRLLYTALWKVKYLWLKLYRFDLESEVDE